MHILREKNVQNGDDAYFKRKICKIGRLMLNSISQNAETLDVKPPKKSQRCESKVIYVKPPKKKPKGFVNPFDICLGIRGSFLFLFFNFVIFNCAPWKNLLASLLIINENTNDITCQLDF